MCILTTKILVFWSTLALLIVANSHLMEPGIREMLETLVLLLYQVPHLSLKPCPSALLASVEGVFTAKIPCRALAMKFTSRLIRFAFSHMSKTAIAAAIIVNSDNNNNNDNDNNSNNNT